MNTRNAILNRQSCRSFTAEQLTEDECNILLEAANAAPVAMGNYNDVEITIIQNKELLSYIEKTAFSAMPNLGEHPTYNAPTVFLVNARKVEGAASVLPFCNASCVVENIMLQAADLELGSVYLFAVPAVMQSVLELCSAVKVSEGFIPCVMVAVGMPAQPLLQRNATSKMKVNRL